MTLAKNIVAQLWAEQGGAPSALACLKLPAEPSALASSFFVGRAAQSSIALAALAANEIYYQRHGQRQQLLVPQAAAEAECSAFFTINGKQAQAWAKYSGLYPCQDGYIRVHANFDHHRDIFLKLLGLPGGESSDRKQVAALVLQRDALELENLATERGGIAAKLRSFEQWRSHPQAVAMQSCPALEIEKIADSPPHPLAPITAGQRPLTGVRVLDLTRILAGPVGTRTLAAYGAEVMTVNGPHLANIEHIIDTGRGKLSCQLDLRQSKDQLSLQHLILACDIFVQAYRPGSLAQLGFDAASLAQLKPGIIYTELSAYGHQGPWEQKRGFDSIVQTATGFNVAEGNACLHSGPKALPVQILDFATRFLMAYGAQMALLKRAKEGGSWRVRVSLLQTANWLKSIGRCELDGLGNTPDFSHLAQPFNSEYGQLLAMPHAAQFSVTPARFIQPSVSPGTHPARWPQ